MKFLWLLFSAASATQALNLTSLKVAFGSCYGWRNHSGEIFRGVLEGLDPALWIWLGDAAYADLKHRRYDPRYIESRFNATL